MTSNSSSTSYFHVLAHDVIFSMYNMNHMDHDIGCMDGSAKYDNELLVYIKAWKFHACLRDY
jgi:hypothetical protein